MNWYIKVLKNYANFSGRARRKEFWFFALFNMIFAIAAAIVDNVLGIAFEDTGYGPLYCLYGLAVLIPGIAVSIRRLHDIGKSGWYYLLVLIPCVGGIILLVFALTPGDTYDNEFGSDPKADEANMLGIV
jgi:uncharacterized membrane protein YhaH (DUF805 family)